jgi:hypothetical protein
MPNYCFFVSSVHLPVEVGYGCSLSVASNVFVITNQTFTCRSKNDAPLWMGNPRCQGDRALAGYRTNDSLAIIDISRLLRLQTGGQGAIALGVRRWCRTAPTSLCRARRRSIVKATALPVHQLARSWLQYRLTRASSTVLSKSKLPLSNFFAKTVFVTDH